jgi:hypothetical protein
MPLSAAKRVLRAGVLSALTLLGLGTGAVRAEVLIMASGPQGLPVGSNFKYTYSITLASNSQLQSSGGGSANTFNGFVFHDVRGYVSGSASFTSLVPGFSSAPTSTPFVGPAIPTQSPTDSASLINLFYQFTGGATITNPPTTNLGTLTFLSTFSFNILSPIRSDFSGATQKFPTGVASTVANNTEQVITPNTQTHRVPEPGMLTLLGFGAGCLGLARLIRRKLQAV